MSVSQVPTLQELVRAARTNLDQNTWDYLVGGAETETFSGLAGMGDLIFAHADAMIGDGEAHLTRGRGRH